MDWLYEHTTDNSARYILGVSGCNPLICLGINPSTAEPDNLDPTVRYVSSVATANGYDSYVMLNVYPQRATNPNDLHIEYLPRLKQENEVRIARLVNSRKLTIWAAWGGLISKRKYLFPLVKSIVALPELRNCKWVTRGKITKSGQPHHPLYVKREAPFEEFDIVRYISGK